MGNIYELYTLIYTLILSNNFSNKAAPQSAHKTLQAIILLFF